MSKLRIAVGIPIYSHPESIFLQSLTNAISHFYEANLLDPDGGPYEKELEVFVISGSMLTENRHRIVAEALNWGATHLLWCDADHSFPRDALCRLWAHNLPIVGCNYSRRSTPTAPTAAYIPEGEEKPTLLYTTQEKAEAGELQEVAHLGFGLCLMDMRVLDALQAKSEEKDEPSMLPLFVMEATPDRRGVIGEDVYFFAKCREAGIKVFCDHGLSWEVGHVAQQLLTNAHAVVQSDDWKARRKKLADKFTPKEDKSG